MYAIPSMSKQWDSIGMTWTHEYDVRSHLRRLLWTFSRESRRDPQAIREVLRGMDVAAYDRTGNEPVQINAADFLLSSPSTPPPARSDPRRKNWVWDGRRPRLEDEDRWTPARRARRPYRRDSGALDSQMT